MSFLGKPVFLWNKGWAFLSVSLWANIPSHKLASIKSQLIYFLLSPKSSSVLKGSGKISLTLIKAFFTNLSVAISPVLATYPLICWMDCLSLVSVSPHMGPLLQVKQPSPQQHSWVTSDTWRLFSTNSELLPLSQWENIWRSTCLLVSEHTWQAGKAEQEYSEGNISTNFKNAPQGMRVTWRERSGKQQVFIWKANSFSKLYSQMPTWSGPCILQAPIDISGKNSFECSSQGSFILHSRSNTCPSTPSQIPSHCFQRNCHTWRQVHSPLWSFWCLKRTELCLKNFPHSIHS